MGMKRPSVRATDNFQIDGVNVKELCGWAPDEELIASFAAVNGSLMQAAGHLMASAKKDVHLWLPLLRVHPTWRRGAQKIGDCVSWGAELVATMLMAIQHELGVSRWITEAATEPIYGGGRVEAQGRSSGGWQDGSFGAAAAKWLRDWGCILRQDYSGTTRNPEHDLRVYDGKKAKNWGNYGCGGQNDNDMLDGAARTMPIQHVVQIRSVEEAEAALLNGYPISIASMAGFGRMVRDAHGIVRRSGQWAHQMMLGGLRYRAGAPLFRNFQSWGDSCSGPDPGIDNPAISACSWWITPEDAEWIFRNGDCWAFGDVQGLPKRELDFITPASAFHRSQERLHRYELGHLAV